MLDILSAFYPGIRITIVFGFVWLAKAGYITWLAPEDAADFMNALLDKLVVLAPAAYATWATVKEFRLKRLAAIEAAKP